jgi:hypothetical protein
MAKARRLLLEYDATAAAQGIVVACAVAGPVPYALKEPVGHIFHYKVLRQQGLIGEQPALSTCSGRMGTCHAAAEQQGQLCLLPEMFASTSAPAATRCCSSSSVL